MIYFLILIPLWFIRQIKSILFWVYLWQLKEYYIGRFFDHFRTEKGKQLNFNYLNLLKIFLISGFLCFFLFGWWEGRSLFPLIFTPILILLYFVETIVFLKNLFQKRLIKPVITKKTGLILLLLIIIFCFLLVFFYQNFKNLIWFSFWLLIIDIFTPSLVFLLILILQPLANLTKSQTIKKAKEKRDKFKKLLVIGITGSYGKTSTKEFLTTILSSRFKVLSTPAHRNTDMAIAQLILDKLNEDIEIFIVEMAAYKRGEITSPCQIVKPKIGILTGINEQHMATYGSQENIIKTKYELIENLPKDGLSIFNGENFYCLELYQKTEIPKRLCNINKTFGENFMLQSDFWVEDLKVEKEFLSFKAFSKNSKEYTGILPSTKWIPGDSAKFKLNLLGVQNIENVLLAAACAKELGINLEEIASACQKIKPEQGGMVLKKGKEGLNIIDATYSANPDGVISHLDYLKIWEGKKIIVMPCLIELGRASKKLHKRIGQKIGEVCDLAIITTKERFKDLKGGAIEKEMNKDNILFIENPKKTFEKIKSFTKKDDLPSDLSVEASAKVEVLAKEDVVLLESRVPNQLISLLVS